MRIDFSLYQGRRVLVTGHTGFKGSWLCEILLGAGAEVIGYSSGVPTAPSLYQIMELDKKHVSVIGDVRDGEALRRVFAQYRPEIVFHLAAQPIVREGYRDPVTTYSTNVMGTVNLMECARCTDSVRSVLNVTTDKVYKNREWEWGYRENEELNGYDPYSNSKSCSELVTDSYKNSFFADRDIAVSTARAGNVIGGGDFAKDRIIPDCVRAALDRRDIIVRNPYSVRPYQHVLEPLCAYLLIAGEQFKNPEVAGVYNVGPDESDCVSTGEIVDMFIAHWGENLKWIDCYDGGPHEASCLKLDCARLKKTFGWKPTWNIDMAVAKTVEWSKCWREHGEIEKCMDAQIRQFTER